MNICLRTRSLATACALMMITSLAMSSQDKTQTRRYQPLHIPELVSGTTFNLNLHQSSKSFWKDASTTTYAYNNENFWGPTLVFNQGETVRINVRNSLSEPTTTHWHGMHIPANVDGGPHEIIESGKSWSPSFKVLNHAGTYWYHPHAHQLTQKQLTYGAGGLIIVRDPIESKLHLPRTYGVDDIPLALTSRRFYKNQQFSFEGDNDKYGDYLLANGTLDPEVTLPSQFVRFRILNAEIERGYNFGFGDDRTFYVIATDGGLVDKPIPTKRMKLMTGERTEILVDLSKDKPGSSIDFGAFNANHPFGYPGGEPGTVRPNGSLLNNINFRILHINIKEAVKNPVTVLPSTLVKNEFPKESDVTNSRTISITGGRPEFTFDDKSYQMHAINQTVKLGATEKWTIQNNEIFGHAFHIHDVQFQIASRSSGQVEEYEKGWKDTMYVPRGETVSFIAKFDDFASDTEAYMYHCHMSNHEDGGLMGEFLVVKDPTSVKAISFRHQEDHPVTPEMARAATNLVGSRAPIFHALGTNNQGFDVASAKSTKPVLLFFIETDCPCSKDASVFFNQLHRAYSKSCEVIGVINADRPTAKGWAKAVGCEFPIVADPDLKVIGSYKISASVYSTIISKDGKINKSYPGYSKDILDEISGRLATLAHTSKVDLNFDKAPKKLISGCPFDLPVATKKRIETEIQVNDRS